MLFWLSERERPVALKGAWERVDCKGLPGVMVMRGVCVLM